MDGYTDAEWESVVLGPMMASFAITAADPSSFIGALQESMSTAKAMAEQHREAEDGSLIASVVRAYEDGETRSSARAAVRDLAKGNDAQSAADAAITKLTEVAQVVRENSPKEAATYITWLDDLAKRVAEAGTEGGFLGFGGEKVSDAEKRTLLDISAALRGATS